MSRLTQRSGTPPPRHCPTPKESSRHHATGSSNGNPSGRRGEIDEWAAKYAAANLPVLPLHAIRDGCCTCRTDCGRNAGKHPLTAHGKDEAITDLRQVTAWWDRWPWANIGIRPPAGVIVLDVDPRNGGADSLLALTHQHGPLPQTLTARTGSGGLHAWLAYAGPARGQLCRGVDVKTERGYVVAPPSVHASGHRYEWITDLPTAPAPRWVRRLLDPNPPQTAPSCRGAGDGLAGVVATAPEGQRNNTLNWAAYRAYERGGDQRLLAEIRAAALSAGLSASEVDKTISSAAGAVSTR